MTKKDVLVGASVVGLAVNQMLMSGNLTEEMKRRLDRDLGLVQIVVEDGEQLKALKTTLEINLSILKKQKNVNTELFTDMATVTEVLKKHNKVLKELVRVAPSSYRKQK